MSKRILYILGVLILGIAVGFFSGRLYFGDKNLNLLSQFKPIRQSNNQYKFIDPLLAYDTPEAGDSKEYKGLHQSLKDIIDQSINDNKAQSVAVYFRDLKYGRWIGVNENDRFSPASLLKVPLMIAYLKIAETKPEILNQKVSFEQSQVSNLQNVKPEESLQPGHEYTVAEVIKYMIIYSDNNASSLLRQIIGTKDLEQAYTDLGFAYPTDDSGDIMSPKTYALYLRLLYNATYLDRDASEHALDLLSQTQFNDGLVKGLPEKTVISHKFGERKNQDSSGKVESQLHDCGIIYYPNNPYLLCVMTKGQSQDDLAQIIANISNRVYSSFSGK